MRRLALEPFGDRGVIVFVAEGFNSKQQLLEVELWRYFGRDLPGAGSALRSGDPGLAPPLLRELQGRLPDLDDTT